MEQRQIFTRPPAAAARSTNCSGADILQRSSSCFCDINNYYVVIN